MHVLESILKNVLLIGVRDEKKLRDHCFRVSSSPWALYSSIDVAITSVMNKMHV